LIFATFWRQGGFDGVVEYERAKDELGTATESSKSYVRIVHHNSLSQFRRPSLDLIPTPFASTAKEISGELTPGKEKLVAAGAESLDLNIVG